MAYVNKAEKVVKPKPLTVKYIADYEPKYHSKQAAAFDLECIEKVRIFPGQQEKVNLGIKFEIPQGYYIEIVPRSSITKRGIILANSVGIIDSDYRGEVFAVFRNVSKEKIIIQKGERLVQCMLKKVEQAELKKVKILSTTDRGEKGHGSTGA